MRILFVAPVFEGEMAIDSIPEMRAISAKHSVYSLIGTDVTVSKVFEVVNLYHYDAIHFSSHMSERGVEMSNKELLEPADVAQLARMAKARVVVLGGCNSNFIASAIIHMGVEFAFFSNREATTSEIWKFTLTFYNAFTNGHSNDVLGAYIAANREDGVIGWTMNPELAAEMIRLAGMHQQSLLKNPIRSWQILVVLILGAISLILSFVAIMR